MKKTASTLIILLMTCLPPASAGAELVRVGLEPFPPLINSDGSGYTIDVLNALEAHTEMEFDVRIMSYRRAKIELKKGNIDLLGHTPWRAERSDFYRYAQELQLKIPTRIALFARERQFLNLSQLGKGRLGTPSGNADFMADAIGVGLPTFSEAPLDSLVEMLAMGRIDAIAFAKGPVLQTLDNHGKQGFKPHYKTLREDIFAGLAVSQNHRGDRLKKELNRALKVIDLAHLLAPYQTYLAQKEDQQVLAD